MSLLVNRAREVSLKLFPWEYLFGQDLPDFCWGGSEWSGADTLQIGSLLGTKTSEFNEICSLT